MKTELSVLKANLSDKIRFIIKLGQKLLYTLLIMDQLEVLIQVDIENNMQLVINLIKTLFIGSKRSKGQPTKNLILTHMQQDPTPVINQRKGLVQDITETRDKLGLVDKQE